MTYLYLLSLIPLGIGLSISADWIVKAVSFFAKKLQVQSFLLGFFILGLATNIPEIFVAYQSIHDGIPQLSVGNLLGGSIFLLACVLGISAIVLGRLVLDHGLTRRDILISSLAVAAPAVALWDGKLTRTEGIILLCVYIVHSIFVNKEQHVIDHVEHHAKSVRHAGHAILMLVGGLIGLALCSRLFVIVAELLTHLLGWSPFIIGLFIITFGTNLPEMTLVYRAIVQKNKDVAFGDVLGSAVIHGPILGVVCILAPFSVPDTLRTRVTLILLAVVSALFFWAASTKKDINRREGIVLFITYLAFVVFEALQI